jgi:hypothetical protein
LVTFKKFKRQKRKGTTLMKKPHNTNRRSTFAPHTTESAVHAQLLQAMTKTGFRPPAVTPALDLYADYLVWSATHEPSTQSFENFVWRLAGQYMPCRLPDGCVGLIGIELKGGRLNWGNAQ